jgi:hypothetical protein
MRSKKKKEVRLQHDSNSIEITFFLSLARIVVYQTLLEYGLGLDASDWLWGGGRKEGGGRSKESQYAVRIRLGLDASDWLGRGGEEATAAKNLIGD